MTRINCIPPRELCDKHLGAEYRELPRVFSLARPDRVIPPHYTLGKGHVLFFYNKLVWLARRAQEIADECRTRNRAVNFDPKKLLTANPYPELYGDWTPSEKDKALNRERIALRISQFKKKPGL